MSTDLEERTEVVTETESSEPIVTHIVQRGEHASAGARVMEAMINGTPVTALCGHTWVPYRDPQKHPVCEKCLEVVAFAADLSS